MEAEKIKLKALGQTIKHEGEVILMIEKLPVDCMALFIDMDTWHEIKDKVGVIWLEKRW